MEFFIIVFILLVCSLIVSSFIHPTKNFRIIKRSKGDIVEITVERKCVLSKTSYKYWTSCYYYKPEKSPQVLFPSMEAAEEYIANEIAGVKTEIFERP